MKNRISALALSLVAVGCTFVACTNEDVLLSDGNIGLAKAPDVVAYSGNVTLQASRPSGRGFDFGTRGVDMNANQWGQKWDGIPNVNLTAQEIEELKDLLSPKQYTENTVTLPFENYWVQQVYKGETAYTAVDKDGNPTNETQVGSNKMDFIVAMGKGGYEHVNNFNYGDNNASSYDPDWTDPNTGTNNHIGTTLMVDMPTTGLDANTQFGYHETWGTVDNERYSYHYMIVQYKGEWYVGFDYHAEKNVNNPGEAKEMERDWCFTDWIVKITPAYLKGTTPENPGNGGDEGGNQGGETVDPDPEQPEQPEPPVDEDLCEHCGHSEAAHLDGFCPICFEAGEESECAHEHETEQPDQPGDEPTDTPVVGRSNEVEVNLNAAEKNDDLLESHLSIHVRAATDVRIFIPVAKEYYCQGDDMEIVMKHETNHMIHGGPDVLEYQLKGSDLIVTLTIEYLEDGIVITTDGIDQAVIDWCAETCNGDGITFEIWNYFNNGLSLDELKYWLNKSTIEFLDEEPDYYINAFTQDGGVKNDDDCNVNIVGSQVNDFGFVGEGEHLNGSPYNEIYKRNKQPENKPEPKPEPK